MLTPPLRRAPSYSNITPDMGVKRPRLDAPMEQCQSVCQSIETVTKVVSLASLPVVGSAPGLVQCGSTNSLMSAAGLASKNPSVSSLPAFELQGKTQRYDTPPSAPDAFELHAILRGCPAPRKPPRAIRLAAAGPTLDV